MKLVFPIKFDGQLYYLFRTVTKDLWMRKFSVLITTFVIAVSLTIPSVSYLLWKNTYKATVEFYPAPELTVYLHQNLSDHDVNLLVEKIRQFSPEKIESLNYISRQQSLNEFRTWSGFGEALDVLDDNPLPAVVILKPKKAFSANAQILEMRNNLQSIHGVREVRLDNGWIEKLSALTQLIGRIAIICTVLMFIAVFLVIGNSVRSDVANQKSSIEVMQLLGATDYFISRPFLYTGIIYGIIGSLLSILFSSLLVGYFANVIKYVTDMFVVQFEFTGFASSEVLLLIVLCLFIGWLSAKIATYRYIQYLGKHN